MKRNLLGLLAVVLAVGFSAFTKTTALTKIRAIQADVGISPTKYYVLDQQPGVAGLQAEVIVDQESSCLSQTDSEFCHIDVQNLNAFHSTLNPQGWKSDVHGFYYEASASFDPVPGIYSED